MSKKQSRLEDSRHPQPTNMSPKKRPVQKERIGIVVQNFSGEVLDLDLDLQTPEPPRRLKIPVETGWVEVFFNSSEF